MRRIFYFLTILSLMMVSVPGIAQRPGDTRLAIPIMRTADIETPTNNTVLLSTIPQTYGIAEQPVNFYDDGGPDGNISEQFNGQATFVPTTPGKKVRIRFTSLNLFNTSSTGKNDVLKVFNGTETDDSQLLATVLKEPVTIHSTSTDGALTVSLKSTTGIPKPGFEAVVEEFTPIAMEIGEINVTHPYSGTASAGESSIKMLLINVRTQNTEPAVSLTGFKFQSTSTAPVASATVYSLGKNPSGTGTPCGMAQYPGAEFRIITSTANHLSEGDNYFMLVYKAGEEAENGQTLDASLVSITSEGKETTVVSGNPSGNISIDNVYYSHNAHATYTLRGSWLFRNTPSVYSYYGYDNTEGNQISTFIPFKENTVAELDFTKFDIMSSNSSYGSPAVFKILDGKDTSSPVLWQMDYNNRKTGPGKAIRATNPDGALTIVFNTNGNRGGMGQGFEAKVSEYMPRPMNVTSIEAFQASTEAVLPGARDQAVIGIRISTDGDKDPVSLQKINIDMKGAQDMAERIKIFYTGVSDEFTTGNILASVSVNKQQAIQEITFSTPCLLPEKDSYFWIAYDMATSFASDRIVDAALSTVTINGREPEIDMADPDGERLTKNIYYFKGGNDVVTVDSSLMFYDNMGPDGKYTKEATGAVTFKPAEGKILRFVFKNFYTRYNDYFYVYSGCAVDETQQLARLSSMQENLPDIISTADDGSLTVLFEPKANNINQGWEIEVQAFVPEPLSVQSVSVTPVNDIKMLRGSQNNKMLKAAVIITGDKGTIDITSLNFAALDTDLASMGAARVWYTGTTDSFNTDEQYGETLYASPLVFTGSRQYKQAGTYYYWLSYDITPAAATGSAIQAALESVTANGENHTPAVDAVSALVTVQEGMHGSYTVGTSGQEDFKSIKEAVDALGNGIDGPVEFLLSDGNYHEAVMIPEVTGSSELNTITMRSASGKRDNVVITYDVYKDPGSSHYDQRYGVFTLDGVDYFTLKDLTVATDKTMFPGILFIRNSSRHDKVENCVIRSPQSTDQGKGSTQVYMYSKNEANRNSDYFTLKDCLIDGGLIGVNLGGTAYVSLPVQEGGHIAGNTFVRQGSKAIYVSAERDFVIENNTVISEGGTTNSFWAIDINMSRGDCEVRNNTVTMRNPVSSAHGLYLRCNSEDSMKEGRHRYYNNEINISGINSAVTGMRFNNNLPNTEFAHNTVRLRGENANSNGIYFSGTLPGGLFANNIVQNEAGGTVYNVNRQTYLDHIAMRDNICHTTGSDFAYVGGSLSFDEWKEAAANDSGTVSEPTTFLSDNILEPADEGSLKICIPVGFVDTDLNGTKRDNIHPTAGAYEYTLSTIAPAMAEGFPRFKSVAHNSAVMETASTLTGTLHYCVLRTDEDAPDAEMIMNEDLHEELRKGRTASITLAGLRPNTEYAVYCLLTSLRGINSEITRSVPFTTTYIPTTPATFEEARTENNRILDGTFAFTGFDISEISDGIGEQPNRYAAAMSDEYAVIQTTNADNLPLDGFFLKSDAPVTLTAMDNTLSTLHTKNTEACSDWTYINLRDMGEMTYLELETEGNASIDNFAGTPLPMSVRIIHDENSRIVENTEVEIPSTVEGGVAPYSYVWTDAAGNIAGDTPSLSFTAKCSARYNLSVTDAWSNTASEKTTVRVNGQQYAATFDDLVLEPESYWNGDKDDEDYMSGTFFSGSYEFNNLYMADWDSWAFFGYSNSTSCNFENFYTDQYNSAAGGGHDGSDNYGVLYISNFMGNNQATLSNTVEGETVEGVWITNSAWVVDAITNGDGMSPAFGKDDVLTLIITGRHTDGSTSTLEYTLADYRAESEKDRWYLDTWQWCDLKPLGNIVSLSFDMNSTKSNSMGITTPTYVCIDDLGTGRNVIETAPVSLLVNNEIVSESFSLAPYFSFDDNDGTVAYTLEGNDSRVILNGDKVTVTASPGESLRLTAHASQRGKHEYAEIPVNMELRPAGTDNVELHKTAIYPNPAPEYFNVDTEAGSYNISVISMDGRTVLHKEGCDGRTRVNTAGLDSGNYMVRISDASGMTVIRKLIVM